ncbi:MAG: hypothetical protein K8T20_04020 [Planctomycetes bacterium]|nr:hypothetical protein [Planctomycetota bacterium]
MSALPSQTPIFSPADFHANVLPSHAMAANGDEMDSTSRTRSWEVVRSVTRSQAPPRVTARRAPSSRETRPRFRYPGAI